jgi:hypothetical protein
MRPNWLALAILACISSPATAGPPLITESDGFRLYCNSSDGCGPEDAMRRQGDQTLAEMEEIKAWLSDLDFPDSDTLEHSEETDQEFLRVDPQPAAGSCGKNATACFRIDLLDNARIYLPQENLDDILYDPSTLAHEYLHSRQPPQKARGANWLREGVATAVGTAWGGKNGLSDGVYPPVYYMTLDRSFFEVADPGYGNWAYLLDIGQQMGSRDRVQYLADDVFMKAAERYDSAPDAMTPLYDAGKVGGNTFDKRFPRFVARFNNMETTGSADSTYQYYGEIEEETVAFDGTERADHVDIEGEANIYAAEPRHLKLEIGGEGADKEPKDRLLMVDIEIVDGDALSDLTLVSEHAMGETQHRKSYMVDGSNPPEELGLSRVVYAPSSMAGEDTDPSAFRLRVRVTPIEFAPPVCFQAGQPSSLTPVGFDPDRTDNWRLETDNGTVDGLSLTPAHAGEMEVRVVIDNPVTRQTGSLAPKKPATTEVSLGTYDVADDDCMIRMTAGPAVITYTTKGSYSEYLAPTGDAIYWAPMDLAVYHNGWQDVPPMARQMMVGRMATQIPATGYVAPGEDEAQGVFLSRMPHAYSKRFAWAAVREAFDIDGASPPKRRAADCPDGGTGCTMTTLSMDGHAVPIFFDAQRRPVRVTLNGENVDFEYGTWQIRRPPGW